MTDIRQVLFIQGGGAGSHDEWDDKLVDSLRRELGDGFEVRYPRMPAEDDPGLATWGPAIRRELARLDDGAIVVGHSVGATILVRLLADESPTARLATIVLLAAPFVGAGGWPADGFELPSDLGARLPPGAPVHVFHGSADDTVPPPHADLYAHAIPQAQVHRLPGRDHQLGSDLGDVARVIRSLRTSPTPPVGKSIEGGQHMTKVIAAITMSADGYITGPNDGPGNGLGDGGERLHYWVFGGPWTYDHEPRGGPAGEDAEYLDEVTARVGATVIGRGMYEAAGHWGDRNPFGMPVFVVTHRPEEEPETGEFTFVGDFSEAIDRARAAAGGKDVTIGGGADVIRQGLGAGLVDELAIIVAPVILGGGKPLFRDFTTSLDLENLRVRQSRWATFIEFAVKR